MKHYTRGTHPNSLKNLSNKKYIVNDQFFETDGFEQGYYAGILAAYGCIVGNNANAISWSVQLDKAEKTGEEIMEWPNSLTRS